MSETSDPIYELDGAWYFWDESWSYSIGPYSTRVDAEEAILAYAKSLEGG